MVSYESEASINSLDIQDKQRYITSQPSSSSAA